MVKCYDTKIIVAVNNPKIGDTRLLLINIDWTSYVAQLSLKCEARKWLSREENNTRLERKLYVFVALKIWLKCWKVKREFRKTKSIKKEKQTKRKFGQTRKRCWSFLRNCVTSSKVTINCGIAARWQQSLGCPLYYTTMYWIYVRNLGHPLQNPTYCQIRIKTYNFQSDVYFNIYFAANLNTVNHKKLYYMHENCGQSWITWQIRCAKSNCTPTYHALTSWPHVHGVTPNQDGNMIDNLHTALLEVRFHGDNHVKK